MLIGSNIHSLDDKGRLFIPAKFREELGGQLVLARGIGKCIFLYGESDWESFSQKLKALPMTNQQAQMFMRTLYASAIERGPDKQGRVLLSAELIAHARIDKEAVIIGMGNRVEIWGKETWETYSGSSDDEYESALQALCEFGI